MQDCRTWLATTMSVYKRQLTLDRKSRSDTNEGTSSSDDEGTIPYTNVLFSNLDDDMHLQTINFRKHESESDSTLSDTDDSDITFVDKNEFSASKPDNYPNDHITISDDDGTGKRIKSNDSVEQVITVGSNDGDGRNLVPHLQSSRERDDIPCKDIITITSSDSDDSASVDGDGNLVSRLKKDLEREDFKNEKFDTCRPEVIKLTSSTESAVESDETQGNVKRDDYYEPEVIHLTSSIESAVEPDETLQDFNITRGKISSQETSVRQKEKRGEIQSQERNVNPLKSQVDSASQPKETDEVTGIHTLNSSHDYEIQSPDSDSEPTMFTCSDTVRKRQSTKEDTSINVNNIVDDINFIFFS